MNHSYRRSQETISWVPIMLARCLASLLTFSCFLRSSEVVSVLDLFCCGVYLRWSPTLTTSVYDMLLCSLYLHWWRTLMPSGCNMCNSRDSLALVACLFISLLSCLFVCLQSLQFFFRGQLVAAITYFLKLGHNNHGLIFTVVTLGLLRPVEGLLFLWPVEGPLFLRPVEGPLFLRPVGGPVSPQ